MSAEQMQAVMTQIQHLVGVVGQLAEQQQHQQVQWQQQGAVRISFEFLCTFRANSALRTESDPCLGLLPLNSKKQKN